MLGGLARVTDDMSERRGVFVTEPNGQLAKDVWVVGSEPVAAPTDRGARSAGEEPGFVSGGVGFDRHGASGTERPLLVRPVRRTR